MNHHAQQAALARTHAEQMRSAGFPDLGRYYDRLAARHDAAALTPERTLDTMSDAIAIDSPNGRMSKRAHAAASARLASALFGPAGLKGVETVPEPRKMLADRAARTRGYAVMAGPRQAKKLRQEADEIDAAIAKLA